MVKGIMYLKCQVEFLGSEQKSSERGMVESRSLSELQLATHNRRTIWILLLTVLRGNLPVRPTTCRTPFFQRTLQMMTLSLNWHQCSWSRELACLFLYMV